MKKGRQHFIPIRKRALSQALGQWAGPSKLDPAGLERLSALLAAIIHHEAYAELEALRDGYADLAPGGGGAQPEAFAHLVANLETVMAQANFEEIPPEEMDACDRETKEQPVRTKAPKWHYEMVRFFRRGQHTETEIVKPWHRLSKRTRPVDVYDDVVVFVRFRQDDPSKRRQRPLPEGVAPGSILIKSFINIPVRDICMLYPDLRIRMTRADALLLGGPALLGAVPILLNIVPALGVVLVLAGGLLGYTGAVTDSALKAAVGAFAVLAGAGAFMVRQYSNYAFKRLKYQKRVADSLYYRNASNHAGVFETLVGQAEDQDFKEAILAYVFLAVEGTKTKENLDAAIEAWLRKQARTDIDFEIGDALAKLERLGLVTRTGPFLSAAPLPNALAALDAHWDNLYDYRINGR